MRRLGVVLIALLALAACSKGGSSSGLPPGVPGARMRAEAATPTPYPIQHIVFIVQENRTFDSIFGGPHPFPNSDAVSNGKTLTGTIPLHKISMAGGSDPNNFHKPWLSSCNASSGPPFVVGGPSPCRMNGFNVAASPAPGYTPPASMNTIYSYVDY